MHYLQPDARLEFSTGSMVENGLRSGLREHVLNLVDAQHVVWLVVAVKNRITNIATIRENAGATPTTLRS